MDPIDAQKLWQVTLGLLRCLWALGQRICGSEAAKLAKSLTKAKSNKMGGTARRHDREQTQMSAFVAHPMGAQKQLRMSLRPLLCLWARGQHIGLSAAPKLAKSLTNAKSNKMGGTAPR